MLHRVVVSMKKLAIEITGIPVDEYAAEIEDGDGAMGCHETNSSWSLYADRVKASARVGLQGDRINSIPIASVLQYAASSVVTASCSRAPILHAVIFCCKALLKRRDQRALELRLLGNS